MKNYLIIFLALFLYINLDARVQWQLPSSDCHYHEVTFLTAHNAYSNEHDGYIQSQQHWCLEEQLAHGVRGFMLDTHYACDTGPTVRLCHGNYRLTKSLLRPCNNEPMSFSQALKIFKNFLQINTQEIITIFLENYTQAHDIDRAIYLAKVSELILKPTDWSVKHNNGWPTLAWMQKHNKRLIIFNSLGSSIYTFNEWKYHAENNYSTIVYKQACAERPESKKYRQKIRHLYLLNYFPQFYIKSLQKTNFKFINSILLSNFLLQAFKGLGSQKLYKYRFPNFIAIDYVNEGTALQLVNIINNYARNKTSRTLMYKALSGN